MRSARNNALRGGCYISLAIAIVAVGALYAQKKAEASTILSQTEVGSTFGAIGTAPNYRGQSFTLPFPITISGATFTTLAGITTPDVHRILIADASGTVILNQTATSPTGSDLVYSLTPTVLAPGSYFIGVQFVSGNGATLTGSSTDPYSLGCEYLYATSSGPLPSCSGNNNDLGFSIIGSYTTATGEISIREPLSGSTVIEFPAWSIDYSIVPIGQFRIFIFSATSTNLTLTNPGIHISAVDVGSTGSSSETGLPVPRADIFCVTTNDCEAPTGTLWYARAEIRDQFGTAFADSPVISFNVLFNPGPVTEQDCDTGDLLCKAVRWLFYPSNAVLNRWTGLWDIVKTKPPFGYITSATGALSSLSTSTTSTISLPPELAGLPFWTPIKNLISFLLYLLGAFWLFNRARHIQL